MSDPDLDSMIEEMRRAPPLYRPARMWDHLGSLNQEQFDRLGYDNFKRTANQNYFNWLPTSWRDENFRKVARRWMSAPRTTPLLVGGEDAGAVEVFGDRDALARRRGRFWYRTYVAMLWDLARARDVTGVMDGLEEPGLGNPIDIRLCGGRISQDLANSALELNAIVEGVGGVGAGERVAELGAGYGRLAYVFLERTRCRYAIFDIPPALHLAQWYLSRLFPSRRVFRFRSFGRFAEVAAEVEAADIAFFTPNQLALVPDGFCDGFVNISSLHEMLPDAIDNYISQMGRAASRWMYLKQWTSFHNTCDGVTIDRSCYRLPPGWSAAIDRLHAVQHRFFEMLALRRGARDVA
jgi:putative sugar O-methyltransferase